jgi:hypothetical protein
VPPLGAAQPHEHACAHEDRLEREELVGCGRERDEGGSDEPGRVRAGVAQHRVRAPRERDESGGGEHGLAGVEHEAAPIEQVLRVAIGDVRVVVADVAERPRACAHDRDEAGQHRAVAGLRGAHAARILAR